MKKIFIIIIFLIGCYQVKAVSFSEGSYLSNTYIKKEQGTLTHYLQLRWLYDQDNKFIYCLNPFILIDLTGTGYEAYTTNYADYTKLTESQWQRVMLLAYYGYGYLNHSDAKWYSVTQLLIWRTVEPNADIYFTNSPNGERITKYEAEISQMESLLTSHQIKPSFSEQLINVNLNQTLILNDNNQVLNQYQLLANPNVAVTKSDNTLTIKGLQQVTNSQLSYQKVDTYYASPPTIYIHQTKQKTLRPGSYPPQIASLNLNVTATKIKLNITNNQQVYSSEAKFLVSYGLYDQNHNLIETISFNKPTQYLTTDLPYGTYYLRQLTTGEGYRLNDQEITIILDDPEQYQLTLPNYVISNEVIVNKYYGNNITNDYIAEANAEFNIYDYQGKFVRMIRTDYKGQAWTILGYGQYQLKQTKGQINHTYTNQDFNITKQGANQKIVLYNNLFTAPLALLLVDEEGNQVNQDLTLKIDQEYLMTQGQLLTADLLYGNYELKVIDELTDYEIITYPQINITPEGEKITINGIEYLIYYLVVKPKPVIVIPPEPPIPPIVTPPEPEVPSIEPIINDEEPSNQIAVNNEIPRLPVINDIPVPNEVVVNPETTKATSFNNYFLILFLNIILYYFLNSAQKRLFND